MGRLFQSARCVKHRLDFKTYPWGRRSHARLAELRDAHRGERCFILGNGPSLKRTDLSKLHHETTFGMNRIYLAFPEMGFSTTYYVAINFLVIEQCADDIQALTMPKFLPWGSRRYLGEPQGDTIFLDLVCRQWRPGFSTDARRPMWAGATVTFAALQLAYHMGFQQVILIGVDHSFASKGPAGKTVVSEGDDPNHFDPRYFGKGFRWQLPDLETSEIAYRFAREAFERDGREVLDATIGGKLTVFPKVDYDSLF